MSKMFLGWPYEITISIPIVLVIKLYLCACILYNKQVELGYARKQIEDKDQRISELEESLTGTSLLVRCMHCFCEYYCLHAYIHKRLPLYLEVFMDLHHFIKSS